MLKQELEISDAAIDIGGTGWSIGIWRSDRLQVVDRGDTGDPQTTLARLADQLANITGLTRIGVAFPGALDESGNIGAWPNRPEWIGASLLGILRRPLSKHVKFQVRDDGLCAALGEARLGIAETLRNQLTLVFGTGLGGAIVVDGQVRGKQQPSARTVGHLRGLGGHQRCPCGRFGCLQLALSHIPTDEALSLDPNAWVDGSKCVAVLIDILDMLDISDVVLCGGLLCRPALRNYLISSFGEGGIAARVPAKPHLSSLLGAMVWDSSS